MLVKRLYRWFKALKKEKLRDIRCALSDVYGKRKRDSKSMFFQKLICRELIIRLFIYAVNFTFVVKQIHTTWFFNICKATFRFFHFKHIFTETDMIFYFACEFTLFILTLRMLKKKREENYAVKNALILYMNFIASEKFHVDISLLFNVFCIAYRSTFFSVLFMRRSKFISKCFNSLFEVSVVVIYILMFFPDLIVKNFLE